MASVPTAWPIASSFVQTRTLRFHTLQCGPEDGPLALLLHGFPELSESWREVMPHLAQAGFRVVAPDLRGYGLTDVPDAGYDIDSLAADVVSLMNALGRQKTHLVAHDWGGAIAYMVAATHPEAVDRLVVCNCPHPLALVRGILRPEQLAKSWYMFAFAVPWLPERALSANGGARIKRILKAGSVDRSRLSAGRLATYADAFSDRRRARAALSYYRQLFMTLLRPQSRRRLMAMPLIEAPTRIVWGDQDIALGQRLLDGVERYFAQTPDIVHLPEHGHFTPIEAADKVGELAARFLTEPSFARAPSTTVPHDENRPDAPA